jgi:hypothetical protein
MSVSMRISGSPLQTLVSNSLLGRDDNRLREQPAERARNRDQQRQQSAQQADLQISEAARQAASGQQITPVNRTQASQSSYQYYPSVTQEGLPSSNQRALQAYNNTQQISRESEGSGEFLGGIDVFV